MAFSTLNNVGLNNPLLQISLLAKFPLVRVELYTKLCEELFLMYTLYFNWDFVESFDNFYQACEPLPFQLFLALYIPVCL